MIFLAFFIFFLTTTCTCEDYPGRLCAFLDADGDQYTDIVTVKEPGSFHIQEASIQDFSFTESGPFKLPKEKSHIVNCASGDFDGDSYPDLLISAVKDPSETSFIDQICLCYGGKKSSFSCDKCLEFESSAAGQPTVLDFNGDLRSDFYVPLVNGSNLCFNVLNRTSYQSQSCFTKEKTDVVPNFMHSFADLGHDYNAEFIQPVIAGSSSKFPLRLLMWEREARKWIAKDDFFPELNKRGKLLETDAVPEALLHPVIGDFDGDGFTDIKVPVCDNKECSQVQLLVWNQASSKAKRWMSIRLHLNQSDSATWRLAGKTSEAKPKTSFKILRAGIHVGDFSLNGYPDLLLVLESQEKKSKQVFLAENMACGADKGCDGWSRQFNIQWSFPLVSGIPNGGQLVRAAFFDLSEDGNLDMVLEYTLDSAVYFTFLKSEDKGDTAFIKAEVFTGACGGSLSCENGYRIGGSGVSSPGGTLCYAIVATDGETVMGKHVQLSQSSYGSLQLPYALFGLGRTPNFVEKLTVGIPQNSSVTRS